ncbi:hypothetical protein [Hymenobacter cavernae]|nr:hypothetical protein [Hymenobacter cavernae]
MTAAEIQKQLESLGTERTAEQRAQIAAKQAEQEQKIIKKFQSQPAAE